MIETRGMDGYVLAILCHIHSHLSMLLMLQRVHQSFPNRVLSGALKAQSETQCIRILETCMMVRP